MATYRKTATGKWQAQVARNGIRKAKTFQTKAAAREWAARIEYMITEGEGESHGGGKIFSEVLRRYAREVSIHKKGYKWESLRIEWIAKGPIGKIKIAKLSPGDIALWRDQRMNDVSAGSVLRELQIISHCLEIARREWGLISTNPCRDVRRPRQPPARDRRISEAEIEQILFVAGDDLETATGRIGYAFLFAIETAMRAGEIVKLTWDDVNFDSRVALLKETKNGSQRRVPLSSRAIELLAELPQGGKTCFRLTSAQLDALFRKIKSRAAIENLHFHDTRHEAITRLAKKLGVLDLARMVGHRDIRMLQIYYNETAEELAKKLD